MGSRTRLGLLLGLVVAGLSACGGGGGAGAASGFDPTQQPATLPGAAIRASGGDGGEGVPGGDAGRVTVTADVVRLRASGVPAGGGVTDGRTSTPEGANRYHVPASERRVETPAALGAQSWSSVLIEGTLVLDLTATETVSIASLGDVRIAGRVEYTPPARRPALSISGPGAGTLSVPGTVALAAAEAGAGWPRLSVSGFGGVHVAGRVDLSGFTGLLATRGGEVSLTATSSVVVTGSLLVVGGSGGDGVQKLAGGAGGTIDLAAPTVVSTGSGVEAFGGRGGAYAPLAAALNPGDGGEGGIVELFGTDRVEVGAGVTLRASGGRGNGAVHPGGAAGAVRMVASRDGGVVTFAGVAEAVGGYARSGGGGAGGSVRLEAGASGGSLAASASVTGVVRVEGGGVQDGVPGCGAGGEVVAGVLGGAGCSTVAGSVLASGGAAVGAADGGAGGRIYLGADAPFATGKTSYPDPHGARASISGLLLADGGAAQAGQIGAGGFIELNVEQAAIDLAMLFARGAKPPASGRVLARPQTVLGGLARRLADDDGDIDQQDGDLDRADQRP